MGAVLPANMNSPERTNIFFLADLNYDKYVIPEKKKERPPRYVDMPTIDSNPNVRGPIIGPDEEYERAWNLKKKREKEEDHKSYQDQMIDLLNRRDKYRNKLNKLNPSKSNEKEKAFLNFSINDLNQKIKDLEELSGIKLDSLEEGSKIMRFLNHAKRIIKKGWKKVTKFFNKYKEPIVACFVVAIPSLIRWGIKFILGG